LGTVKGAGGGDSTTAGCDADLSAGRVEEERLGGAEEEPPAGEAPLSFTMYQPVHDVQYHVLFMYTFCVSVRYEPHFGPAGGVGWGVSRGSGRGMGEVREGSGFAVSHT
jgi:hypothetical protein